MDWREWQARKLLICGGCASQPQQDLAVGRGAMVAAVDASGLNVAKPPDVCAVAAVAAAAVAAAAAAFQSGEGAGWQCCSGCGGGCFGTGGKRLRQEPSLKRTRSQALAGLPPQPPPLLRQYYQHSGEPFVTVRQELRQHMLKID